MFFATMYVLEQATLFDIFATVPGQFDQGALIGIEIFKVCALQAIGGADETQVHHVLMQANGFKQLSAAITGNGGNSHL